MAPEDIHVYSIDEVFIDATPYLRTLEMTGQQFAKTIIQDILATTGITATARIGSNLFLCKIAMDIVAKRVDADEDGVRIAELTELSYRRLLWDHQPLTDFWRVGRGNAKKLFYTMGDIVKCSLGDAESYYNEHLLYKMFGPTALHGQDRQVPDRSDLGYQWSNIQVLRDLTAKEARSNSAPQLFGYVCFLRIYFFRYSESQARFSQLFE